MRLTKRGERKRCKIVGENTTIQEKGRQLNKEKDTHIVEKEGKSYGKTLTKEKGRQAYM